MNVKYEYYSPTESYEEAKRREIISYAGRLLEAVDAYTLIVSVDDDDKPVVFACNARLGNALTFCVDRFMESSDCKF